MTTRRIVVLILTVLLAVLTGFSAFGTFQGAAANADPSGMNIPQPLTYFVAAAKAAAAIGILVPALRIAAVLGLFPIYSGAIAFHVAAGDSFAQSASPAIIMAVLIISLALDGGLKVIPLQSTPWRRT